MGWHITPLVSIFFFFAGSSQVSPCPRCFLRDFCSVLCPLFHRSPLFPFSLSIGVKYPTGISGLLPALPCTLRLGYTCNPCACLSTPRFFSFAPIPPSSPRRTHSSFLLIAYYQAHAAPHSPIFRANGFGPPRFPPPPLRFFGVISVLFFFFFPWVPSPYFLFCRKVSSSLAAFFSSPPHVRASFFPPPGPVPVSPMASIPKPLLAPVFDQPLLTSLHPGPPCNITVSPQTRCIVYPYPRPRVITQLPFFLVWFRPAASWFFLRSPRSVREPPTRSFRESTFGKIDPFFFP